MQKATIYECDACHEDFLSRSHERKEDIAFIDILFLGYHNKELTGKKFGTASKMYNLCPKCAKKLKEFLLGMGMRPQ